MLKSVGRKILFLSFAGQLCLPANAVVRPGVSTSIADVVEKVIPGVVNIQARLMPSQTTDDAFFAKRTQSLDKLFQMFLVPGFVGNSGRESRSLGSGFFYRSNSIVVTNYHVVRDAAEIFLIVSPRGAKRKAQLLGFNARADLAVLKLAPVESARPLKMGSSEKLRIAEGVFAIGNPFGYGHSVTTGILSAKGRTIGSGPLDDYLQTDAAINPGNSGGPLFNLSGEVIGINTATSAEGPGISFALPAEMAKPVLDSILFQKKLRTAWLGVVLSDLIENQSEAADTHGAYVRNIVRNSPAERAGVRVGDVILGVDNELARDARELQKFIGKSKPGSLVSLKVFRDGQNLKLKVPIGEAPEAAERESF